MVDSELKTWTVVGHWDNGEIVAEYFLPGEQQDQRIDNGYWDEGLFAASAQGRTPEEALAAVRAEYESN
jgi:hypothetical protein